MDYKFHIADFYMMLELRSYQDTLPPIEAD